MGCHSESGRAAATCAQRNSHGFSLTELLVVLAAAGLLMSIAIPEFTSLVAAQKAAARINTLAGAIHTARHLAISHNAVVTLCPGQGSACGDRNQWREGMLVFIDRNRDRRIDDGELVGARLPGLEDGERIVWRSFGNDSDLRFRGNGLTDWQAGHFQYCPADGDARFARQLILNAQGRPRHAVDTDGDGLREDASGNPLNC